MKALITGITGFAGSYLAELLLKEGFEVYGTDRWRSRTENIEHLKNQIKLFECDIKDASSVKKVMEISMPDHVYHLAAQSFVLTSWNSPNETLTTNITGELNIFEAVRALQINPMIQIAGSSEEYGCVSLSEVPIKETNPLRPLSPYAVSKVAQDLLGYQYFMSYGLKIIRTRAFNHEGPRRGEVFVTSNFAKQIAMIEKGKQEPILMVGNLEAQRDFSDVRDIVYAYFLSLKKGVPGEVYNICSGKSIKIKEMLDMLLSFTSAKIKLEQDPLRMRPSDVEILRGNCDKFKKQTGWAPKIPLEKTLKDLLDYWREKIV